jgi:hypothetical protein
MTRIFKKLLFILTVAAKWSTTGFLSRFNTSVKPVHILFCLVDHYEPGTGNVSSDTAKNRVQLLLSEYPKLAARHKDSAGNIPRRTWFFPPHYHQNGFLRDLVSLCAKGYGEIELHLHHGKHDPDTSENLETTIRQCIEEYSHFGIFGSENGQKKYGFIHGDWALDNSRHGQFCGVNNELEILTKTGCFADFTFPSLNEANPAQINSIYYAKDDLAKPKSYNYGNPVKLLGKPSGDLMVIQGPLYPYFKQGKISGMRAFGDGIDGRHPVDKKRVDLWVKTGIHVHGKRNWIIVKTHTHGATDSEAVLGKEMDDVLTYLEHGYNDGVDYLLHYVTARELYNIIKAIEAGEAGTDPEKYRNYKIKPPVYDASLDIHEASETLKNLIAKTYRG